MNLKKTCFVLVAVSALSVTGCSKSGSDFAKSGKEFLEKGDVASAVIEFKNAVQLSPSSADARTGLAQAQELSGDLAGAEQNYRRALELGGDADDLIPRIALLLLDRSDHRAIVRDFDGKRLENPSADSELRGIVALSQLALGRKEAAQAQLNRAKSKSPAVKLARAQMAATASGPQDALSELDDLLKEGKAPWWILRAASRLYAARGDQAKALETMKGAYELAGWHQGVIGEYAELLFQAGRSAEAKPLRDKLRKIAPRYYRTAYIEALFYMEGGKFDEAHDAAVKVLAALPDHIPSQLIAAKVEIDRGEFGSAENRLRKVLAANPSSLKALQMRLMLEVRRGDVAAAAMTLERALRIAPNDRNLLAASAEYSWARGDKSGAIKQLTTAAQMPPPQVEFLTRLAEMKFALGQRSEASQTAGQAIDLAKDDTRLRENAFRALLRMNMLDRAREMAKAELERRPREPEPFLWMAAVIGSEGNETAALEQTGRALDVQPDYYPALLAMGRTATTPERTRQYENRLQKAIDARTKNARIYLDLARHMRLIGADADKVGAVLMQGVAADPGAVGLRAAAINHWLNLQSKDKALALAMEGESAEPDNLAMKELAAATQEMVGNLELAAAKYAELHSRFPDRIDWGMKNAQLLARTGKPQDAIQLLRKLSMDRAEEPALYRMLAMLQLDQKQSDEALLTANMLVGKPAQKAAGLLLRGDIYARLQDKGKALKAYEEAAKAGAAEAALLRRVELHDRTGGETFAAGELRDWLSKHPNSVAGHSIAVRRASAKQDHPTAIRHLETLARLSPGDPVVLNDLAWAYAQTRNPAALATAEKAVALAPDNPQILDTLAEAQGLAGQRKEAVASLRRAMALAPRHPVVRVHLAELLAAEGNKKEVAALLEGLQPEALDREGRQRLEKLRASL